jgi:hypothetical protein
MKNQYFSTATELQILQRESFRYFEHETNPENGLVLDKTAPDWPCSIAAVGMALTGYPIAVERGFITREAAIKLVLTTLRFFWHSKQSDEPDATGYHGFYYHFLDMKTGRRVWECELSTIDSAFFLAGALTCGEYFSADTPEEVMIRALAKALFERADWQWFLAADKTIAMGWTPENGFLPYQYDGYDEALLLYILGLGSPGFPLPELSYVNWTKSYQWQNVYGFDYLHSSSLFAHQLSHIWIDFRGLQDEFMLAKGIDYFENSRRATMIQQQYAIHNPHSFAGYGEFCWGLTASDGPGPRVVHVDGAKREFFDYVARGVPDGPDDGTISPWVAVASLPFAPEIVLPTIDHFIHQIGLKANNPYGFKSTFNPTYPCNAHGIYGWISPYHFAINEGPILLMVENYRTQQIWNLMRNNSYVIRGLKRAGFSGGWL